MSIGAGSPRAAARRHAAILGLLFSGALATGLTGCRLGADPISAAEAAAADEDVGASAAVIDAAVTELRAADRALRNGDCPAAIEGYREILARVESSSPAVEAIRVSLMEAQWQARLYEDALLSSDLVLQGDASASSLQRALDCRYEIGLGFLNGNTRRILGLSVSSERRGLQILDDLVERYPFQAFTPDAIYHIASWYLGRKEYAEAELLFQRLLRDYPDSAWCEIAEYRIGETSLRQLKGVEYDLGSLDSAERRFRRYLKSNPTGDQAGRARENLVEIERIRAQRWLSVARFYLELEKGDSADVYLRKLQETYPGSAEAAEAAVLLERPKGGADGTP